MKKIGIYLIFVFFSFSLENFAYASMESKSGEFKSGAFQIPQVNSDINSDILNGQKCVRGCENWGFFAEFLWTVNHFEWCERTNQIPVVYWDSRFAYYSKDGYNGSFNCWEYYFEPVSHLTYEPRDHIYIQNWYNNFTTIWWYAQYIQNIDLLTPEEQGSIVGVPLPYSLAIDKPYPVKGHLYSTEHRRYVKSLLDKYVTIKPNIQEKIDTFYASMMEGHRVVGLHLRGSFISREVNMVPLEILCEEANKHADENTLFFIATDQSPLLECARKLLKGKVIAYDCYRQSSTTSPWMPGQWPPIMGEDVVVETVLLSLCDHLVHTISNVSTAALYFNPEQPHTMLYCDGRIFK